MLWMVRHHLPRLVRFTFNCYRHEVILLYQLPRHLVTSS
jgi:hypothetical protein